jgi:ABC-type transport system involved in cytochrome bd biosynthesis fused ATPase/permease subunit
MDQVIWMEQGRATVSTHRELMQSNPEYRKLYEIQTAGASINSAMNEKGGGRHA